MARTSHRSPRRLASRESRLTKRGRAGGEPLVPTLPTLALLLGQLESSGREASRGHEWRELWQQARTAAGQPEEHTPQRATVQRLAAPAQLLGILAASMSAAHRASVDAQCRGHGVPTNPAAGSVSVEGRQYVAARSLRLPQSSVRVYSKSTPSRQPSVSPRLLPSRRSTR